MKTTSFTRVAVGVLAVWLGGLLLLVQTATAHPGHHRPGRKILQEAIDPESYIKSATSSAVTPETAAAAANALAATAVPIPEASATAADVSAMIAAASTSIETPPAGGYKRCASDGGNKSQRNAAERRFKKLVAPLEANGMVIGPNHTANSELTTEAGGISTQQASAVSIPVYFHVITYNGQGRVLGSMLSAQLTVLNNAFRYHGFQFSWARAWEYTATEAEYTARLGSSSERAIRQRTRQGTRSSLNIWTWDIADSILGFATFPWEADSTLDGVVLKTGTLPGGNVGDYNEGNTATHEVGHWLGLYHTFEGSPCSLTNDYVPDTPAVVRANTGCPRGRDSCPGGGPDLVNNYMDYTWDSCIDSFTAGQGTRMRDIWRYFRNGL